MYMYVKTILKNYHTMLIHLYFKCRNKNSLLCIIFSMSFNQPNLKILLNSMSILSVLYCLFSLHAPRFFPVCQYFSVSYCIYLCHLAALKSIQNPFFLINACHFFPYWYYHGLWNTNVLYFYIRSGKQLT